MSIGPKKSLFTSHLVFSWNIIYIRIYVVVDDEYLITVFQFSPHIQSQDLSNYLRTVLVVTDFSKLVYKSSAISLVLGQESHSANLFNQTILLDVQYVSKHRMDPVVYISR